MRDLLKDDPHPMLSAITGQQLANLRDLEEDGITAQSDVERHLLALNDLQAVKALVSPLQGRWLNG